MRKLTLIVIVIVVFAAGATILFALKQSNTNTPEDVQVTSIPIPNQEPVTETPREPTERVKVEIPILVCDSNPRTNPDAICWRWR